MRGQFEEVANLLQETIPLHAEILGEDHTNTDLLKNFSYSLRPYILVAIHMAVYSWCIYLFAP